jgi:hypothetical protein
MLFSPEIDAMKGQMTAIHCAGGRVAREYFIFLQQSDDVLELREPEYTASFRINGFTLLSPGHACFFA